MTTTEATRDNKGRFTGSKAVKNGNGKSLGMLAGAAAGGVAVGLLALFGRKAIVQAPSALAHDWVEALIGEHRAVAKIFDAIEATDESATLRRSLLLAQLKHALTKHAIEEENVIYPALRDAGNKDAADLLVKEHGYVKQYLYELANTPSTTPEWMQIVSRFRADLEDHVAEEENNLFPMLRATLSEEKNKALAVAMNKEGFKVA
ncbi:hemerythrin domain-containing protein [Sphingomonas sp. G-3-2-10]|uniref:hemerythrin domain-containing protein n=1 Tax=Sphingomonas sp. G-3-2-10 TaxID=2728838 RepID=UPI00146E906D|nr:hemerythrin domain-containing protein [Sphingomonas sp. G-3-2-10]NML05900.1 hemerythrin domain-containing protein [Sphingomonas sp. G-3-2-10]